MDIKEWAKTADGIDTIGTQNVFCCGGILWQGSRGAAIRCTEDALDTDELKRVRDVDGTMEKVWFRRHQRIESRYLRKAIEFDERRGKLRRERNEIRSSMKEDRELGLPVNPEDLDAIKRIDDRMGRLVQAKLEMDLKAAELGKLYGQDPPPDNGGDVVLSEAVGASPKLVRCPKCDKEQPPGRDGSRWLKAHDMGAHIGPAKRAENKRLRADKAAAEAART